MVAFYNEIDAFAAQWLRNLIAARLIPAGHVEECSIVDLTPRDLVGFDQCHFFAGIGGWPLALGMAGWPDDRPVWTGSCPCQPFSGAGRKGGFDDARHLWPDFLGLIRECRPRIVFGEQVASADGLTWLSLVQADLEAEGYANAGIDLCAAGIGSPHIRQRLWWVARRLADAAGDRRPESMQSLSGGPPQWAGGDGLDGGLADTSVAGFQDGHGPRVSAARQRDAEPERRGDDGGLADTGHTRRQGRLPGRSDAQRPALDRRAGRDGPARGLADSFSFGLRQGGDGDHPRNVWEQPGADGGYDRPSQAHGFWRDADWLYCRDGKWRPVEPGTFPLAHGVPQRVGRLRAYGNAIVPQVAAEVISAVMEVMP